MTFKISQKAVHAVRVLELNLWQRYGAWAERRSVLIDGIRTLQPDLVAFAESIKTIEYDQTVDLLGEGFNVVHSKTRDASGMGVSIASRWPLEEVQEVDLNVTSRTAGFPCTALVATVTAPEPIGRLLFVNHFPNFQTSFEYERELQAIATARVVEERAAQSNQTAIVAGDFDAAPEAASVRFWSGRQSLGEMSVCYRDAWESVHPEEPGHTFTPDNPVVKNEVVKGMRPFRDWPFRRIDYIFLRFGPHGGNALNITACERIFDEPVNCVWGSDHFGLVADFAKPQ